MEVQTFRAATLQEALQLVRQSMGPDAAVLHTRKLRQSRMGLFPKSVIEVDASNDIPVMSRFETPARLPGRESATVRTIQASPTLQAPVVPSPIRPGDSKLTPAMFDVLSNLLDAGIDPHGAKELLTAACESIDTSQRNELGLIQARINQFVANDLRTTAAIELMEDEQKVVAFVGPTGVGKTTTLAKIAANYHADFDCQIGFITFDTCRHGAVDQLLQYAELISASLEVVSSPDQVNAALRRLRECDLVLVDTAGRSPKDSEQLAILADFLNAAEPDAVHLVLSATSSTAHIRDAVQRFSVLNPASLVVTKLDEVAAFGEWLPVLQSIHLPVSYVTAGQHVEKDLSVVTSRRLASMLLGQTLLTA